MKVHFCSAPCGSGKTRLIVQQALALVQQNEKVLILQPTRTLIDKTVNDEIQSFPNSPSVKVFHKGTVGKNVANALADYVKDVPDEIQAIVIATHAVLPYIKHFENKYKWHVFVDEAMQVVRYQQHQIPHNHHLLTSHLEVTPVNGIYGEVSVGDDEALKQIAQNEDDDEIFETLSGTCRVLRNEYWETFVNIEQYDRLRRREGKVLAFHSVLQPEILGGFASVRMASANFEDSQVFKVWSALGVQFKPDPEFARGLRYSEHPNGHAVTIYYVTDHQWSRKRRKKVLEDGTTILDHMVQAAKKLFPTGRFLWHANKSIEEDPFGSPAQRLPNKPHGLNSFMEFDDIIFLSSLNPPPDHFNFLKQQYGLDGHEVRGFTYLPSAYQAIMRTSIRDPKNQSPKRILGPDWSLAAYLQEILPGSKVERLDIGIVDEAPKKRGRCRKHKSNRERVAAQRQRAREEKLRLLSGQLGLNAPDTNGKNWDLEEDGTSCAENGIKLYTKIGTQRLTATIYSSVSSSMPKAYVSGEIPAFVQALRFAYNEQPKSKEDMNLFSPAIFDPNRSIKGTRKKENILYLRHIVLDFEDGELQPDELPRLFPDLQMVVTNTFRHTRDKPRYRAVIFTNEIMTPEVYGLVYNSIADKLEEAGYAVDRKEKRRKPLARSNTRPSGLDWSKSYPTSLFYLPCQGEVPKDNFFHEHIEGRDPLKPSTWIENSAIPLQPAPEPIERDNPVSRVDERMVKSAISTWRTSPSYPGRGNVMFFDLALSLKYAGMAFSEIERTLRSEAQYARTPNERFAQIPGIINGLRTYSASWGRRGKTQAIAVEAA